MSDDRFQLPDNFGSSGDPVDGNPFPPDNPRHAVWAEATRAAEIEVCELNARSMGRMSTLAAFMEAPLSLYEWLVEPALEKFDIWAKRGIQVVWSDPEVALFDQWLVKGANAWLSEIGLFFERNPAPFPVEMLRTRARNAFAARVQHWKLETRRYRELQRAASLKVEQTPETATVGPELKQRRRLVLARYRKANDLTVVGFARKVGISESAIRGIVNEDSTRFSQATQLKLLEVLKVTHGEWYRM